MLKEISIMRPLLILLLVLFHSFIIYGGGWEEPVGFVRIPLYRKIAEWTYAFMLESFTFISGYVWLYTSKTGGGKFWLLVMKKAKRLLVPMLVFGFIYFICFMNFQSLPSATYEVLNGVGHLWYLPMLFWCFVEAWLLRQIRLDERIKLSGVTLLAVFCSELPMPFRIATSFYYLFYFYLPVLLIGKREAIYSRVKKNSIGILMAVWVAFITIFIIIRYVGHYPHTIDGMSLMNRAVILSLNNAMQMVYTTLGVMAFYLTAVVLADTSELTPKDTLLVKIGSYCFGVYIFQQFLLKGLYFHTSIPGILGPYILPWVGVVTALVVSFVLTFLIRLTKVGRAML